LVELIESETLRVERPVETIDLLLDKPACPVGRLEERTNDALLPFKFGVIQHSPGRGYMSIIDHLAPGEQVITRFGRYYATSHRVLWYAQTPAGEEVADLPYYRLRSVVLVRNPNHRLMAGGTILAVAGFLLTAYIGFITGPLAIIFGVGMVLLGAHGKEGHYLLRGEGLSAEEQRRWRIPYRGSLDFMATIGQRSGRKLQED